MSLSNYRVIKEIAVPAPGIGAIVAGNRSITADTDLRLCRFFGRSDSWWVALPAHYDLTIACEKMAYTWV